MDAQLPSSFREGFRFFLYRSKESGIVFRKEHRLDVLQFDEKFIFLNDASLIETRWYESRRHLGHLLQFIFKNRPFVRGYAQRHHAQCGELKLIAVDDDPAVASDT